MASLTPNRDAVERLIASSLAEGLPEDPDTRAIAEIKRALLYPALRYLSDQQDAGQDPLDATSLIACGIADAVVSLARSWAGIGRNDAAARYIEAFAKTIRDDALRSLCNPDSFKFERATKTQAGRA